MTLQDKVDIVCLFEDGCSPEFISGYLGFEVDDVYNVIESGEV